MTTIPPIIFWFRRGDLRLTDNPALVAAAEAGQPVIPVFLYDVQVEALGPAARWRLEQSLAALAAELERLGSRLILRRGAALAALEALVHETGASAIHWGRHYDPVFVQRDTALKSALQAQGVTANSSVGNVLFEPWTVATKAGTPYRVFTSMWRSVRALPVPASPRPPARLPAPEVWPDSDCLSDWRLAAAMGRGAAVLLRHVASGEAAAQAQLDLFVTDRLSAYADGRDQMGRAGTSGLSAFLATGEIGARQCWHTGQRALQDGVSGAQAFLRQLVWREFACHLLFHEPDMRDACWRPEWERFPWERDETRPEVRAWKRGCTGVPLVDAAMREMMVTGQMHNRGRMIAASYLTKHLMADWRIGERWFAQHLVDWDAANNAMGWQWVAGCGPDASPFFRVFNPELQAGKFDRSGAYRGAWIAEGQARAPQSALDFFEAAPRAWKLDPAAAYPAPVVGMAEGRARALAAYHLFRKSDASEA